MLPVTPTDTRDVPSGLTDATAMRDASPRHVRDLALHLARAEVAATHRLTVLGWAWPLARQLAQLAVLVFVFSKLLDLDIENFGAFVFCGLVVWTWFSSGVSRASTSLLDQRHLLFQPRFPAKVVPVVAIIVPLLDVLFAYPVLLLMLVLGPGLGLSALAVPLLVALQLVLMAGIAWGLAAASVFFRDVPNLVGVGLLLAFYLTPVFYGRETIPSDYRWVLHVNPVAILIDANRAVLLGTAGPGWTAVAALAVLSTVVAAAGYVAFDRAEARFVDHL